MIKAFLTTFAGTTINKDNCKAINLNCTDFQCIVNSHKIFTVTSANVHTIKTAAYTFHFNPVAHFYDLRSILLQFLQM